MFPTSRLWAAARAAHGSIEAFFDQVPSQTLPKIERRIDEVLNRFERAREQVIASEAEWEGAFFGNDDGTGRLAGIEEHRLARRTAYNELRRSFAFITRHTAVPTVRWELSSPMELAADYARVIHGEFRPFAAPEQMPGVAESRRFQTAHSTDYWIRFASPSNMQDHVVARVSEPQGMEDPPTLIFLHGIGVEFDHWRGMIDEAARLTKLGFRVVRPEAPWHGRRVPDGRYGGEKFIATLPRGSLQYSSAQVREVAVILDWCRATSTAPVALGGSSLGAHMARVVSACAHEWPQRLRPDALLLLMPCGRLEDAAIEGSFARVWGTAEASGALGWSPVLRRKWLSIIDPVNSPTVASENIVAVLGTKDRVTPYASGEQLVGELRIPEPNVFRWPLGHFSIPLNMVRNPAPLERFRALVERISAV